MKKSGTTLYRVSWEGNAALNNSQAKIVALAAAFQADNTGLMLEVTLNVSTKDINTGATFVNPTDAYNYGKASALSMATDLLPYKSVIIGISCGNEMTDASKDGLRSPAVAQGTNPADFVTSKFNIFRQVELGCEDGIKQAGSYNVGSNALIFSEFVVIDMLLNGTAPDGSTGYRKANYDYINAHSYNSWGDVFNEPYDGAGWAPHFNYIEKLASYGKPVVITEMNGDAPSQTDAQMKTFMDGLYLKLYKNRFNLNIAFVCYYEMFSTDYNWGMLDSTTFEPIQTKGQAVVNFIRMYPDDIDGSSFDPVRNAAMEVLTKYPGQCHVHYPKEQSYTTVDCQIKTSVGNPITAMQDMAGYPQLYCWQTTQPPLLASDGSASYTSSFSTYAGSGASLTTSQDHAFIIGCKPSGSPRAMTLFAPSTNTSAAKYSRAGSIAFASATSLYANWTNDTPADFRTSWTYTGSFTDARVITSRKVGTNGFLRVNGSQVGTTSVSGWTTATMNGGYVGKEYGDDPNFFTGNVYILITVVGTIPDADLLALERWANKVSNTGVSF